MNNFAQETTDRLDAIYLRAAAEHNLNPSPRTKGLMLSAHSDLVFYQREWNTKSVVLSADCETCNGEGELPDNHLDSEMTTYISCSDCPPKVLQTNKESMQ